ncbi:MAG: hypothetical protein ACXWF2_17320, partial [Usitatibacter sp.]
QHGHEVDVAVPSRHHVPVQVIGKARARAAPEVRSQVEAEEVLRAAQARHCRGLQLGERRALGALEQFGRG